MKNNSELINGEIYLGFSFGYNFIGRYNAEREVLEKCLTVVFNQRENKIDIFPINHPAFMLKKIEINKYVDIDIHVDKFMFLTKLSDLAIDEKIREVYIKDTSPLILNSKNSGLVGVN